MQTILIAITLIITVGLIIFIIRINNSYKDKMLDLTNKMNYFNIKIEMMFQLFEENKRKMIHQKKEVKNVLGKRYDELDEVIIKYLDLV